MTYGEQDSPVHEGQSLNFESRVTSLVKGERSHLFDFEFL